MHAQVVQRGEVLATEVAAIAQLLLVALDVLQKGVKLRERLCTAFDHTFVHLLILMLGHVGLELEVGTKLAGAELAQVGAIDEDHLLGLQLVPCILTCWGQGLGLGGARQGLAQPCAVLILLPARVQGHDLYSHRVARDGATTASWRPHFVGLHVFLDIGLLGKGTATGNALEGLLSSVAADVLLQVKVFGE